MWHLRNILGLFTLLLLAGLAACGAGGQSAAPTVPPIDPSLPTATPLPTVPPTAPPPTAVPEVTATATPIPPRTFIIDPDQSIARYRVEEEFFSGAVTNLGKELGFFTAVGWTREISGQIRLAQDEDGGLAFADGRITVQINTLTSDESRRDQRIREQYLESDAYPVADFTITQIDGFPAEVTEGEAVTLLLTGDMTIREITNQETFTVTAALEDGVISGSGTTQILMVDYGFDPPEILGFMRAQDPARIEIELVLVESETASP